MNARLLVALVALMAAFVLAACGDDDDEAFPTAGMPTGASVTPTVGATESSGPTFTPVPTDTSGGATYIVEAGDTLFSIANRFGVTVEGIAAANGIADPTQLFVGQVLVIPGGSTAGPTPPPVTGAPGGGPAAVVRTGDTSRRAVALTFDAGSDAGYTAMILDVLAANGVMASFGMTGKWAETYPDLLRRIVGDGHTLINHSYDHASFTGRSTGVAALTREQRWEQLDRTEAIVQEIAGVTTKPEFRPPFGDYDDSVNADVGARGYVHNVMWTVDSRGWMGLAAPEITQRCLELAEPGGIYVFHVGSASQDGPALQGIVDGLRASGYAVGGIDAVLY